MVSGSHFEEEELEDELPPNCASAGLTPARSTNTSRPTGRKGRTHTPGLNCLGKNPHMIVAILDA
jgi:hypothetical protein